MQINNSTHLVYSVLKNLEKLLNKKNLKEFTIDDVFKYLPKKYAKQYTVDICIGIYSDIENGYYTFKDMIIYYIYQMIFDNKKVYLKSITQKNVKNNKKLFTIKQLKEDCTFVSNINKKLILKLDYYFKINDGQNHIYVLTLDKYISPIFYLQYSKKYLPKEEKNNIFMNDDFNRFEKLINIIFNIIKVEVNNA